MSTNNNDKKISQLPLAQTLTGSEIIPILQDGVNKAVTAADIANLASAEGAVQPENLAEVAFSGSYLDLLDKPTILQGEQGPIGPVGPQGPKGEQGDPATNLVSSVNGKIGNVVLNAEDVGAASTTYVDDAVAAISGGIVSTALTSEYHVDGDLGNDVSADGSISKPYKTIQACLNMLGQPTSKTDYMRHITIHVRDCTTSVAGNSPQSFNGVYRENLVVPSRSITIIGKGIKIGGTGADVSGTYGNILREVSSSRRFGAGSSDFRPCLTLMGIANARDSHNRLRNGMHIGGSIRTAVLTREFDSVQGNGSNKITVHLKPGQHPYNIVVSPNFASGEPYIRIKIQGTTNYNGGYDITEKIDNDTFVATRMSGTNTSTILETAGSFFETDSTGGSGQVTHDGMFVNTYMQGTYTVDDGTVNVGGASFNSAFGYVPNTGATSAGQHVLYAIGTRFFSAIEGRALFLNRWENVTVGSTMIVGTIAGLDNVFLQDNVTTSTFTYGTSSDENALTRLKFTSTAGKTFTVSSAGQNVYMDTMTHNSFLRSGWVWVTNTPTLQLLGSILSGATAARPTFVPVGFCFYDTTLSKPIWLKSAGVWVDSTGATV